MGDLKVFSPAEVAKHSSGSDCWFIINGKVYDVTNFLADHPGGEDALLGVAGKDGTDDFDEVGHSDSAKEQMEQFFVGFVEGHETAASTKKGHGAEEEIVTKPLISNSGNREIRNAPVEPQNSILRFLLPLLLLGVAFALRFFAKKDVEEQ